MARLGLLAPLALALTLMMSQSAVAGTVAIDFEDGASLSPVGAFYQPSFDLTFENALFYDLKDTVDGMSGTFLIFHETLGGYPTPSDPIVGVFSVPVSEVSIVAIDVGWAGARIDAFDSVSGGSLVGFDEAIGITEYGVMEYFTIGVPGPGIRRIELYQPGSTAPDDSLAWDNLSFTPGTTPGPNPPTPPGAASVPLPSAAWAGLGLLAVIGVVRRRLRVNGR